ncbi:MFS transporter, partial [Streptomyces sp. NPDC058964]|uniref:MFS transporter n=1 Tax=Streptomyces sp. NPDC058964 TaxID=3346681 RepID=UPI0036D1179A
MTTTTHPVQPLLSARRRWTVLAVCCLSMFLVGLDTTIVNVGLPAIGRGLGVGTRSLEWTVDAYTLVLASLLISSGALADRFGRRRVFQSGLAVFGVASLAWAGGPPGGAPPRPPPRARGLARPLDHAGGRAQGVTHSHT